MLGKLHQLTKTAGGNVVTLGPLLDRLDGKLYAACFKPAPQLDATTEVGDELTNV